MPKTIQPGLPSPLGASLSGEGVNFALFSRHASHVSLQLFTNPEDAQPHKVIDLDAQHNRTGDVWHVWVKGIKPGALYAYRVDGPYAPEAGHRFNVNKLLLDPMACALTRFPDWDFEHALGYDPSSPGKDLTPLMVDNAGHMPKCVVVNDDFDWHEDILPKHPWANTIIYETHVRGFSVHSSSGLAHPGTYRGLIEKIPYLKELGVTTVELLPVQEFNETQVTSPLGKTLKNYWGYDPVVFKALKASYSSAKGFGGQVAEFREMVLAFHKAGLEVILDVVFNHTAETDVWGSTLSQRGIDNSVYYILDENKRFYKNYTGTGNTLNANEPAVQEMIIASLRWWAQRLHVDGFRFDLASILNREGSGNLLSSAPVLENMMKDPVLKDLKLIAEPWDAVGAYQLGRFSGTSWREWNDRFRDDVRRFWRSDDGLKGPFASRICGSSDIFSPSGKNPSHSINFVTCHDGFTLNDLVSYRYKRNMANKQNNQDGTNENFSDNGGAEGEPVSLDVQKARQRQIKNFLLSLFIARGVPMLLGGDEFCRTQAGNNNAYCQDNEISWYNWNDLKKNKEIFNFTRGMIAFRQAHPVLAKGQFYNAQDIQWFNTQKGAPNWDNPQEKQLGCLIFESKEQAIFLMFNASFEAVQFNLPSVYPTTRWYLAADTSRPSPQDCFAKGKEPLWENTRQYPVGPRSSVILLARQ
ncbi:MAG: glycogen debranching protein GlgX [Candidatus Omnitrophica bacterium]|nr:glycogen debranching protein GlgX [Candidatus Omnitrophota bacterium]